METPFQKMHDENMKFVVETCEHGNSHHCQSCEVKYLKYVIEEQQKKMKGLQAILDQLRKKSEYEIQFGESLFEQGDKANGHFREGLGRGILFSVSRIEERL